MKRKNKKEISKLQNGKAFTLIELLAVIVILSIIALIAVPIVLNIIEDTNKSAAEQSMQNIEKAADLYYQNKQFNEEIGTITFICKDGKCKNGKEELEVNGRLPENGTINIDSNGSITFNSIILNGYSCIKKNKFICEKTTKFKETSSDGLITLKEANSDIDINYKIYGNSIQEGTPTPDSPKEIKSVGDKINLLNIKNRVDIGDVGVDGSGWNLSNLNENNYSSRNNYKIINHTIINDNSNTIYIEQQTENGSGLQFPVRCDENTIYTLSYIANTDKKTRTRIHFYNYNGEKLEYKFDTYSSTSKTFTTPSNAYYMVIQFESEDATNTVYKNIQLEKGDIATEFVTYGKYRIPIKLSGANVARVNEGQLGNIYMTIYGIPVKKDQEITYIVNYTNNSSDPNHNLAPRIYSDESFTTMISSFDSVVSGEDVVRTIKMPSDGYFSFAFGYGYQTIKINKMFVGFGKYTIKDYTPYYKEQTFNIYLDEPLRCVGEVCDYIDFERGKVVRSVKKIILNGEEDWSMPTDIVEGFSSYRLVNFFPKYPVDKFYTSHYMTYTKTVYSVPPITNKATSYLQTNQLIFLVSNEIANSQTQTSTEQWKNWLKNNNIDIHYILENPIEEEIELPNIKLNKEGSNILIDTKISPSKLELDYYR